MSEWLNYEDVQWHSYILHDRLKFGIGPIDANILQLAAKRAQFITHAEFKYRCEELEKELTDLYGELTADMISEIAERVYQNLIDKYGLGE